MFINPQSFLFYKDFGALRKRESQKSKIFDDARKSAIFDMLSETA